MAKATLAGGCFWCTEAVFRRLKGVNTVVPGYAGGTVESPSYEEVSSGCTGHAESTQIEFDPAQISYETLLEIFFATHDPTTKDRQGNDVGPQYRSVIFYHDEEQRLAAERMIAKLTENHAYSRPIVTEIVPYTNFYIAEDYHKNYYENHRDAMYCQLVIDPKIAKLTKQYSSYLALT